MRDELDEQIDAYEAMLPELIRKYGDAWVMVSRQTLVKTFEDFSAAAQYALKYLPGEQVLIRNTGASPSETAPFVRVSH